MNPPPAFDVKRPHSVADALVKQWQLDEQVQPYRSLIWDGSTEDRPVLHLEDVTGIPFVEAVSGVEEYQHRARVRADSTDLFAAGTRPAPGYEEYCQEVLGLGEPTFVHAAGDNSMAVAAACMEAKPYALLKDFADRSGGLNIHPYMAIDEVWQLAGRLDAECDTPVRVVGPAPPVLWVANDKSKFSQLVGQLLGEEWLVKTERSNDPRRLAATLRRLARHCEQVGLKRTRCASAMGNAVFDAEELLEGNDADTVSRVEGFLRETEWTNGEEVLVVQWCDTDLSPSTQLWIPPEGEGPPVMEGVYEQLLKGPQKVFVGSRPSTMPDELDDRLGEASLQVATALQRMGYVGRCSFDFIVVGDPAGDCTPKFIECNGRWGGTSTPMYLVDRLVDGDTRPPYIATDYYLPESLRGMNFPQLRDLLEDHLFDPATGNGRFILYNVGPLEGWGKFDIISLGDSAADARDGLEQLLPQLLKAGG